MDIKSTPFLSYSEIKTDKTDLFEDAFGLNQQFSDVIGLLNLLKPSPGVRLTRRVAEKAKKIQ